MPAPRSKVIKALEREILWELDQSEPDGWVVVYRFGQGRPRTLPWTFSGRKADACAALVDHAVQACKADIKWARGFPAETSLDNQLRWLRRRGHWVQKAIVRTV